MPTQTIPLVGGLVVGQNRLTLPAGVMVECLNYTINKDGRVVPCAGDKAFSGGCLFDTSFTMIATYSGGDPYWGQFGPGFTTPGGDVFTSAGYAAQVLVINSGPSCIVGGIVGRLPFTGERISNGTGILQDNTLSFVSTTGSTAINSHRWMTHEISKAWSGIADVNTPGTAYNATTGSADVLYCNSPLGYPPGMFYWKDRLHVVCDIAAFAFGLGASVVAAGNTVYLYHSSLGSGGPYTVERVILTSGSWVDGDAAGTIWLIGTTFPAIKVQDQGGTTNFDIRSASGGGGTLYAIAGSQVAPAGALLVKDTGPYIGSPTAAWSRIDLGYEVPFNTGGNAFVVVNRLVTDARLTSPQATDFKNPDMATSSYWTSPNNAKIDDGSAATITSGTAQPFEPLAVFDFGFNIPSYAIITGIEVKIKRRKSGAGTATIEDNVVTLIGVGSQNALNRAKYEVWKTSYEAITYGSATDLWGLQISPAAVNDSAFGVRIEVNTSASGSHPVTAEVDYIQVRVHYKPYEAMVYVRDATSNVDVAVADVVWYYKDKGEWTTTDAEGVLTLYNVRSVTTQSITGITRAGDVATATKVGHGYSNGDKVVIAGAAQADYNGEVTVFGVAANTFNFNVQNTPTTPATGTITASAIGAVLTDPSETIKTGLRFYSGPGATGTLYASTSGTCERVYLPSSAMCEAADAAQYEFTTGNFYSNVTFEQVFGVNGAGPAFSYDGKYAIRIRTGLDFNIDRPRHVAKHGSQLALGYASGDVTFSDVLAPESFAAVSGGSSPVSEDADFAGGALTVNIADRVHGLVSIQEQSLAVFCKDSMVRIAGSAGTFTTQVVRAESGVIEYTVKDLGGLLLYTDFRGPGILQPSDVFGQLIPRYVGGPISAWITPRLQQSGNSTVSISGLVRAEVRKAENQYRLFFRDRYVLTMTLVGQEFVPQFSIQRFDRDVRASCAGTHSTGAERSFYSTSGTLRNSLGTNYVYQTDVGMTFNGESIQRRALFYLGSAESWNQYKRFNNVTVHASAHGYLILGCRAFINHEASNGFDTTNARSLVFGDNGLLTVPELESPQPMFASAEIAAAGFALLLQIEQFATADYNYETKAATTDLRYMMPHSLDAVSIQFEMMGDLKPRV